MHCTTTTTDGIVPCAYIPDQQIQYEGKSFYTTIIIIITCFTELTLANNALEYEPQVVRENEFVITSKYTGNYCSSVFSCY